MADTPDLTDLEYAAWRGFLEAHRRVTEVLEAELRDADDLPYTWYDVLVQLSESPSRTLRMQELADRVLLSKSGLTRLIDRMERQDLVTRSPCEDDGRGVMAVMTDTGFARLEAAYPTHVAGVRAHFAGHLKPGEAAVLSQALARIAAANQPG